MVPADDILTLTIQERERFLQWLRFPPPWESAFQQEYYQKSLRPLRISFLIGAAVAVGQAIRHYPTAGPTVLLPYGITAIAMLGVLVGTRLPGSYRYWQPCGVALAALVVLQGYLYLAQTILRSPDMSYPHHRMCFHLLYQISILVLVFAFARLQMRWFALFALLNAAIGFLVAVQMMTVPSSVAANLGATFMVPAVGFFLIGSYFAERTLRGEFLANHLLEAEHNRAEELLLNVLPEPVASRLKKKAGRIADQFEQVTILFADIVNFTPLSARMPAEEVVQLLDDIFSAFDALAEQYHLEKIKTVGDAYMAVCGVPEPQADHLIAVVEVALKMQETISTFHSDRGEPLQLRIGINSGAAIAGVIGTKRFIYDLWSDAVNIASRMESHGVPGRIQVTEEIYQRLAARYRFSGPQEIEVKGRGRMRTYFLDGYRLK